MKAPLVIGVILVIAGVLALVYGGFSYTKDRKDAEIGPVEITVKDREHISMPTWAGVASIVVGGGLLLFPIVSGTTKA